MRPSTSRNVLVDRRLDGGVVRHVEGQLPDMKVLRLDGAESSPASAGFRMVPDTVTRRAKTSAVARPNPLLHPVHNNDCHVQLLPPASDAHRALEGALGVPQARLSV